MKSTRNHQRRGAEQTSFQLETKFQRSTSSVLLGKQLLEWCDVRDPGNLKEAWVHLTPAGRQAAMDAYDFTTPRVRGAR